MADRAAAVPEQGRPFACRDGWHRPAFKEGRTQTRDSLPIEGGRRLCASTGNEDRSFAGIFCRWELSWQASTVVARGRACPRVPAHPQMYPSRTREMSTRRLSRQQRALFAGLLPKPPDGLEPSTPSLPWRFGGNGSQPTATVFACFSRSHGRPFCHRLPPVATARLHKRSNPRGADASYERLAETHRRRGGDPRVRGREQQ
jgi:hypothetical protein